jgi:hypothetical protein
VPLTELGDLNEIEFCCAVRRARTLMLVAEVGWRKERCAVIAAGASLPP